MEDVVARQFNETIRSEAAAAFGVAVTDLTLLGDFESYVYAFKRNDMPRVLRITHDSHRAAGMIESELDWVKYLAEHGLRVARPVRAQDGRWTVTVGEGQATFHACAFERVPGRLTTAEDWSPELYRRWGAFLGVAHRITRGYTPPATITRRIRWNEDPYWLNGGDWIPQEHETTRQLWASHARRFRDLPEEPESFGICHTDLHPGNFHVHNGDIYAFDTDDCSYHWFIEDLSSALYYGRGQQTSMSADAFARTAWPEIWGGYRSEYDLSPNWIDQLEMFMQWRRLTLYALVQMKCGPEHEARNTWETIRREKIDTSEPIFGVDLRALIQGL